MKVKSQYSKSFHSDNITRSKYDEVMGLAIVLRDVRNELSQMVSDATLSYLEMSKIDFQKAMLPIIKDKVHSNFTKQLCDDVYISYQNRFKQIRDKMKFLGNISFKIEYYKRNTKKHKICDVKSRKRISKSTQLSKVMSYLAMYGSKSTFEWISTKATEDIPQTKFYNTILNTINKFGYERIMALATMKRQTIIDRYPNAIAFKSLSFRGRSRLTRDIASLNRNRISSIKAFVEVSWLNRGDTIKIPVKHSYAWHGRDLSKYSNGTDTSYTVCIEEKTKELRIILSYEDEREYRDIDANSDVFIGFDANSKHSQLIGSKLDIITDHNRLSLDKLISELKHIDDLKSKNTEYVAGKRRQYKIEALRRSIKGHTQMNCASICKTMYKNGFNHAVFENLNKSFGKTRITNSDDFNYNRLISEMKLCSIKDEFEHIARHEKYGFIATSFVQPEYTSQECSVCHYIDEDNRKTQEDFVCLNCGHTDNADSNAAQNIEHRVSEAVQRDLLLDSIPEIGGAYRPKTLKRDKVKDIIQSRSVMLDFISRTEPTIFVDSL